ncbi:MAG: hypothetical protein IT552_13990 [Sphingomonadaceae bacterium]|nr:hypothetical protein [Sphingomonadaceae bacterium]
MSVASQYQPPANGIAAQALAARGGEARAMVLLDGEYYVVGKHLLAALQRGETPAELEIDPEIIDEDML